MVLANDTDFRRALGPWSAGALVAGSMIGTGIFLFVSKVAEYFQSAGSILLTWCLGAIIAGCGALCLAELAAAYPKTGGVYFFLLKAFGQLVAFLYAWSKFLIMRVGSFSIMALVFGEWTGELLGVRAETARRQIALGAILLLTGINVVGVRAGGRVQNALTGIKVIALLGLVAVAAGYAAGLLDGDGTPIVDAVTPQTRSNGPWLLLLGAALIPVLWTFGGWDESPFVAEEVRDPQRNLPVSILVGVITVSVLFLVVNGAYLLILSPQELSASEQKTAIWAMQRSLGPAGSKAITVLLIISAFGAANGMALTGARIAFAAGRDQALFEWFARTHPRTKTPVRGLTVQACLACLAVILMDDPFDLLLFTGLAYWAFAALTGAAVIVMRQREPDRPRPFRVWLYPLTPALFILVSVGMAASVVIQTPQGALATVFVLLAGVIVFVMQLLWIRSTRPTAT